MRDNGRFEVFGKGDLTEPCGVLGRDDHRHTLLRFGNGKLGAVQTLIFLRNGVQVDIETVRKLADGDGNAARAEVVAALDHPARFRVAEQTL